MLSKSLFAPSFNQALTKTKNRNKICHFFNIAGNLDHGRKYCGIITSSHKWGDYFCNLPLSYYLCEENGISFVK